MGQRASKPAPRTSVEAAEPTIIILSGGTGRTADELTRAALAQFSNVEVRIVRRTHVRTQNVVRRVVREAAEMQAIICHSLVAPKLRAALVHEAERQHVPLVDVLGPLILALEDRLGKRARMRPGLSYALNRERFDRMDALDFMLAHDDGARVEELDQADVVLVGASRVSKSVTALYLAFRGIRAANVPLIRDIEPPAQLLSLDPSKVIGLTMNPKRLQAIRTARARRISPAALDEYTDVEAVAAELAYAQRLMTRHRWRRIDVSYSAVEDVAKEIIEMLDVE